MVGHEEIRDRIRAVAAEFVSIRRDLSNSLVRIAVEQRKLADRERLDRVVPKV